MLKLLISPLAQGAYFDDLDSVSLAEVSALYPEANAQVHRIGPLSFIDISWPKDSEHVSHTYSAEDQELKALSMSLMRLSFVQAVFQPVSSTQPQTLRCLETSARFKLPKELVWGSKYRGKTNELVTQLGINLAIHYGEINHSSTPSLLDPMAGRGTTLLWAARYGLNATGMEIDKRALEHFQRDTKRQTKLHKLKHKVQRGSIGQGKRSPQFLEFKWPESSSKLIQGDSRQIDTLTRGQRFHYLVSDLPYGVQFGGEERRNPFGLIAQCAPAWTNALRSGGVMVLLFNSIQPKYHELRELLASLGLKHIPFSAPHRLSESIRRDLIIMRKD